LFLLHPAPGLLERHARQPSGMGPQPGPGRTADRQRDPRPALSAHPPHGARDRQ
jgi:hypothetical protein